MTDQSQKLLRARAEEIVAGAEGISAPLSPEESERVIHELNVHQIELEMQNDELRKTQVELERLGAKYYDLYHSVPVAYFTLARDGTCVQANHTAENLLALDSSLVGKQFNRFIIPADQDVFYFFRDKLAESSEPGECELHLRRGEEDVFLASLRGSATIDGVHDRALNIVLKDITEARLREQRESKMKERLAKAQKLESVGLLAGGIAHDFNNMLNVILGHTELAKELLGAEHPAAKDLEFIETAANRSASLTSQLLQFARKQIVFPEVLAINTQIDSALDLLARVITKNIELKWVPGKDIWNIRIDPAQFEQVLVNLCFNASHAVGDEGVIEVETKNVTLRGFLGVGDDREVSGDYVCLLVRDNGVGMSAGVMERIFEPFFSTKEQGKGTGLGLATVEGIVKQNGGLIAVESQPNQGTTFKLFFPRSTSKKEA